MFSKFGVCLYWLLSWEKASMPMGKKKVEEEWKGRQSILSSVKIPGLMSCYYFIITVKKTEDALQCSGLVVLPPHFRPLFYSSVSRATRWPPPGHAGRRSDDAQRMRCVATEHSKLTGSQRSRSGAWPFHRCYPIDCQPEVCALGDRGGQGFFFLFFLFDIGV